MPLVTQQRKSSNFKSVCPPSASLAKPFVKWVGGKGQILQELDNNLPPELRKGKLTTYVEPFLGGGSAFLHITQHYPFKRIVVSDINKDLILAYWSIQQNVRHVIHFLNDLQTKFSKLRHTQRSGFYYRIREHFNHSSDSINLSKYSKDWAERTALLIFLNKTCFNGLFRVNSSGFFNVAFGKYDNPRICDPDNLMLVAQVLKKADILLCDFDGLLNHVDKKTFVYLDPPYRPISNTSNFTSYSQNTFTALDQQRLAKFCTTISKMGSRIMISSSDPTNVDPTDHFFEQTYSDFKIVRILANRMVNCKADRRGKISELLIKNY